MKLMDSPLYVRQADCLNRLGETVKGYGAKAFVIGGQTALSVTHDVIEESLAVSGVKCETAIFSGYCSESNIKNLADAAKKFGADVVIGVGGGRALDTSKEVADALKLPIVTVPTIAATCAAWTPLSVMYDDSGVCVGSHFQTHAPRAVYADTRVIAEAPHRYLVAGIGDSMAKWFEPRLVQSALKEETNCFLRATLSMAASAYEHFMEVGVKAVDQCRANEIGPELEDVIDICIAITGILSGIAGDLARFAMAHGFHDAFTVIPSSHHMLHGEKVALGILLQCLMEDKGGEDLARLYSFFGEIGLPRSLKEAGIGHLAEDELESLVNAMMSGTSIQTLQTLSLGLDLSLENLKKHIRLLEELELNLETTPNLSVVCKRTTEASR